MILGMVAPVTGSTGLPPLVTQIAKGDQQALSRLYDATSRLVYGLALRIVKDPATAEEITLEVYMQVWRTSKNYEASRGSVTAWLAITARSRALDWLRSRQSRLYREGLPMEAAPQLVDLAANPEVQQQQSGRAARIREAMQSLPPEQRQAIDLGFYDGLSHSEIAERLNLPLGTIKSRMRMGMIKLRELLGSMGELA
ncbi:MAG: sigma-70 family RNA polymerase sigma factor [Acidobacteriota bacterium]